MDPITISIVTALAAGAVAGAKDIATSAVKDAYTGLKQVIHDRYRKAAPFVEAVEANPTSKPEQQDLANQLHQSFGTTLVPKRCSISESYVPLETLS